MNKGLEFCLGMAVKSRGCGGGVVVVFGESFEVVSETVLGGIKLEVVRRWLLGRDRGVVFGGGDWGMVRGLGGMVVRGNLFRSPRLLRDVLRLNLVLTLWVWVINYLFYTT